MRRFWLNHEKVLSTSQRCGVVLQILCVVRTSANRSPNPPWPTPLPRSLLPSQCSVSACDARPRHSARAPALPTLCPCPANRRPPIDERGVGGVYERPSEVA